ncbi:DUF2871 domain-containing protein [Dermabacteraceae bacterium TAE3-ERU27]|nr:DUF2871 domain-containing protein [Dermabacteraceae bacterium TAE3-ERU27]
MKKLYYAVVTYTVIGVLSGFAYREIVKSLDFTGYTQLSTLHTHFFALGMIFFLIVLLLDGVFSMHSAKGFNAFFWLYNAGLAVTGTTMAVRGTLQALGNDAPLPALAGIAGLGHVALTVGLVLLLVMLGRAIDARQLAQA